MTSNDRRNRDRRILDYVDTAEKFLEASRRLLAPNRFDVLMYLPCGFMISHSAELILIAYLQIEGVKGKQAGHDLAKLLDAAKDARMQLAHGFDAFVRAQNDAHKLYQFRYPNFDSKFEFVDPSGALGMVGRQASIVRVHVLARIRERWGD